MIRPCCWLSLQSPCGDAPCPGDCQAPVWESDVALFLLHVPRSWTSCKWHHQKSHPITKKQKLNEINPQQHWGAVCVQTSVYKGKKWWPSHFIPECPFSQEPYCIHFILKLKQPISKHYINIHKSVIKYAPPPPPPPPPPTTPGFWSPPGPLLRQCGAKSAKWMNLRAYHCLVMSKTKMTPWVPL